MLSVNELAGFSKQEPNASLKGYDYIIARISRYFCLSVKTEALAICYQNDGLKYNFLNMLNDELIFAGKD